MAEELSEETFPCTLLALADYSKTLVTNHNWLSDEGANTALFHAQARYCKQQNFVAQIVANGQVYTEQVQKAGIIDEFYFSLLGQNAARKRTINLEALGVPSHDLSELDAPFSEEEVWNTIKMVPPDKAP